MMETPRDAQGLSTTSNAPTRASLWRKFKGLDFKRFGLLCAGLGFGVALAVIAVSHLTAWFASRPISAHKWKIIKDDGVGLEAVLKTDWKGSVRYQFGIEPRSSKLESAFDETVRLHRHSISFGIHLYDKGGFELCETDVKPTPSIDDEDRIIGLVATGTFSAFECSRSAYKEADHWDLSYVFPALKENASTSAAVPPDEGNANTKKTRGSQPVIRPNDKVIEEDDTLTGFDSFSGNLETLSGVTYVIRQGEKIIADMWINMVAAGERQPHLHITCMTSGDCLIENTANHQTIHGRKH